MNNQRQNKFYILKIVFEDKGLKLEVFKLPETRLISIVRCELLTLDLLRYLIYREERGQEHF